MHRKSFLLISCLIYSSYGWTTNSNSRFTVGRRKRAWSLLGQTYSELDPLDVFLDVDFKPFDESSESEGDYYNSRRRNNGKFDNHNGAVYVVKTDDSGDVLNCVSEADNIEVTMNESSNGVKKANGKKQNGKKSNGVQKLGDFDIDVLENRLAELEKIAFANGKLKKQNGKRNNKKPIITNKKATVNGVANTTAATTDKKKNDGDIKPTIESWESRLEDLEKQAFTKTRKQVEEQLLQKRLATLEQALASLPREDERVKMLESQLTKLEETMSSQQNQAAVLKKALAKANDTNHVLKAELEDLRSWDTVTVTWEIENFEHKLVNDSSVTVAFNSGDFWVAGYKMHLQMEVSKLRHNERFDSSRKVGAYLMHKDGLDYFPISVSGTQFWLMGGESSAENNVGKTFGSSSVIKQKGAGLGWADFATLGSLREKYLIDGSLKIVAKVHVKRVTNVSVTTVLNAATGQTRSGTSSTSSSSRSATASSSGSSAYASTRSSSTNPNGPSPF